MDKIDTREWKNYKVTDLFDIVLSTQDMQAQKSEEGDFPLVSSGKTNNGICKYISRSEVKEVFPNGSITVDMFGKVFYQPTPFAAVSHGRVNILIPKIALNEMTGLFIAGVLEAVIADKYSFTTMCSKKMISNEVIKIPVTSENLPDYAYMEEYMRRLEDSVSSSLTALQSAQEQEKKKIDVSEWKEYKVGELFGAVERGYMKSLQQTPSGDVPVVGAGAYNQGITGYYDVEPKYKDKITVSCNGAGCGSCFYHDYPFNMNNDAIVLIEKYPLSAYIKTFLSSVMNTVFTSKYSYEDKCSAVKILLEKIKLPSTPSGEPDWGYIESYMREIEEKIEKQNPFSV